ncbi:S-layer-like domain-containing protein [Gottschalkia purinilytica]|uniref:S-layer-like domain-containing protein n=1 Tax=Gottschalkia purinilytica TaxID=1503 RepID=A0A0L0W6N0_GOTPU|nr:S-layer homology domain-containing protein [Gottschalkia purinilytica]KNF07183.1 S-layer-like domain-containing protein [Gottschalkia purinilytica]
MKNKFLKQLFVLFIALSVVLVNTSVSTVAYGTNISFKDVPNNHWAKQYIETLASSGTISGYPDGTFKPENNVTRGEFSRLIVDPFFKNLSTDSGNFKDVSVGDWYSSYVATAVDNGLIAGYEDKTFKPNNNITRVETAVIVGRFLKNDISVTDNEVNNILSKFNDKAQIPNWAKTDVARIIKSGIMSGVSNTQFSPNSNTTRAQAATVIYGTISFKIESEVVRLTNIERNKIGLAPFTIDFNLGKVARIKSQDMADKNYFDHTSPTYGSPFEMMKKFGIKYMAAGENIAKGYSSAEGVVNGWMNSPGHKANILSSNFGKIGVGYVKKNGVTYWTQMFIN